LNRAALGTLASVPAIALPAVAISAPVDPIFAAIERHRVACRAFVAAADRVEWHFSAMEAENKAEQDARGAILSTVPMTLAGMGAMLRYLADVRELFGPEEELKEFAASLARSPVFA
jgi:hypothetical protein